MKIYFHKLILAVVNCSALTLFFICSVFSHPDDEVTFFNVGQGHAVLIRKGGINEATAQPYVPLLIDAGSTAHPFKVGERYEWIKDDAASLSSQITTHILHLWRKYHRGQLSSGKFNLNIIVTHPDKDHQEFIPPILRKLRQESESQRTPFTFRASLLLGGEEKLYPREFDADQLYYSNNIDYRGLHGSGALKFLESSGCITHLFCPRGIKSDPNRWSIVTRIQLDHISAVFTGDADSRVKQSMLTALSQSKRQTVELQSDILHIPHHGAKGGFLNEWDAVVNPRALVIGSGLHDKYNHPQGVAIFEYISLLNTRGRLWENNVMPHAFQYHCKKTTHNAIGQSIESKGRLFDVVPLLPEVENEEKGHWHMAWTDIPIYTLWTTGTLVFNENVNTPVFSDAPNGLMTYVAVPEFKYLLPPQQRTQDPTLVSLMDIFLVGGEGDSEQITRDVLQLSNEGDVDLLKKGIILTDGLSLYQNRSMMLQTLLSLSPAERLVILELAKPLTRANSKNFSVRYRILKALGDLQSEKRKPIIDLLKDHFFSISEDPLPIARALNLFGPHPIEESRGIIALIQPFYPSFEQLTPREKESLLAMIEALLKLDSTMREKIFNVAQPFIMPRESSVSQENPLLVFHDVSSNASLVNLFSSQSPEAIGEFSQLLQEAWSHLTVHGPQGLYGENKHYFIEGLFDIPVVERGLFIKSVLPLLSFISEKQFESWVAAVVVQQLARIYAEPFFSVRVEYLCKQETQRSSKQESVLNPESLHFWLGISASYAQKVSSKNG